MLPVSENSDIMLSSGDKIAVSNSSLADVYTAHMFQYMFSQEKFKYIVIEKKVGYFSENFKTI